jgi:hypothetical protein
MKKIGFTLENPCKIATGFGEIYDDLAKVKVLDIMKFYLRFTK